MFFQISVTPNRSKKTKCVNPRLEEEEENTVNILSLAPFTSTPKLFFEDINVGTKSTRKICIRNPTKFDIKLYVEKEPPGERNVGFNWKEMVVSSENEELFVITWRPLAAGAWRDVVSLWDGNRIKRDIPIAFKSIKPKEVKKAPIGVKLKNINMPEQRKQKNSPTRKSPPKKFATLTNRNTSLQQTNVPNIHVFSPTRRATFNVANKENRLPTRRPINELTNFTYIVPEQEKRFSSGDHASKKIEENFDDSLELSSPLKSRKLPQHIPYTPLLGATSYRNDMFTPELTKHSFTCSTEEKSYGDSTSNVSGGTYVKLNASHETYVKGNTSRETYVKINHEKDKANLSGGTYVKDSSIGNLASLQMSPIDPPPMLSVPSFSNLGLSPIEDHSLARHRSDLDNISEESSSIEATPKKKMQNKRKTSLSFDVSPAGKNRASPVKRLSQAYGKKALHLKKFVTKTKNVVASSTFHHNPDTFFNDVCNPYMLAATSGVDPFIAVTMYYDPQWVDEQILRFKNWMNVLLIPPANFDCKANGKVDVAKLWQESRNKEVAKAPTKEHKSNQYNQNHVLQSLRRNAMKLYRTPQMVGILSKCVGMVNNDKFTMRTDKNIHRDVGLQKEILRLFFCYNPLWLRIGLETVYSVHIKLRSNSDVLGLTEFLLDHYFNEPYLLRKYKSKLSPMYVAEIKRHAIKKFLSLIYFLDQAKLQKLVPYDPCLFCKNAPIKESKDILLRFSSELFSAIGDVTKPLRIINYVLSHQQSFINEFEYGVENLGTDLKDGVRLTRIMEIILLETNLTDLVRVPAISRLQKIYNVKLAFDALKRASFTIEGKIEPKDIVDGHKEKTLSFLWQIIYKFQSPRITKAVTVIQVWWRSEEVQLKLAKLREERKRKQDAAVYIMKWYLKQKLIHKLEAAIPIIRLIFEEIKRNKAATRIQTCYRMFICRKQYLRLYQSTLVIQRSFRNWLHSSHYLQKRNSAAVVIQRAWKSYATRQRYLRLKEAVAIVERTYIANRSMRIYRKEFVALKRATIYVQGKCRANWAMTKCRLQYLQLQRASCIIQSKWKATRLMHQQQDAYLQLKSAVSIVQSRYRATIQMRQQFNHYQHLKNSVVLIQTNWRATLAMKHQRQQYLLVRKSVLSIQVWYKSYIVMRKVKSAHDQLKKATLVFQQRFRAQVAMKQQRQQHVTLKLNVVNIQRRFKANQAMKQQRQEYLQLKNVVVSMQHRFRANLLARHDRDNYCKLKQAVGNIETRYIAKKEMEKSRTHYLKIQKACDVIQTKWRAVLLMRKEKCEYLKLKLAVSVVQQRFRANIAMRKQKRTYELMRDSVSLIQTNWRATLAMKQQRQKYLLIIKSLSRIQIWYKSYLVMRKVRTGHDQLKQATLVFQRRFRAQLAKKQHRQQYLTLKLNVENIQRRFRANQAMKQQRQEYLQLKNVVVSMQRRFRANLIARHDRDNYCKLKQAVGVIETRYNAKKEMEKRRSHYLTMQKACNVILTKWRAVLLMRKEKCEYLKLKIAVSVVQQRFRANIEMRKQKKIYELMRDSVLLIQTHWRATLAMKQQRQQYLLVTKSVLRIQIWYKSYLAMRKVRSAHEQLKRATLVFQRRFRAQLSMKQQRQQYLTIKRNVVNMQRRFRANQAMKEQRQEYLQLKNVVVSMQRRLRANLLARQERDNYCKLKQAVGVIETRYNAKKEMEKHRSHYLTMQKACNVILTKWRAVLLMRREKCKYLKLKLAVSVVQQRFRANIEMQKQKKLYELMRDSVVLIQTHLRATLAMKQQRHQYLLIIKSVTRIQVWYKSYLAMRKVRTAHVQLKRATLVFQRRFRAQLSMKQERQQYLILKRNVVNMQRRFRANQAMKKQRQEYLQLKNAVVSMQRRFRANLIARHDRDNYCKLKLAVRVIESRYIAKKCRTDYLKLQDATILIQRKFRAQYSMRQALTNYVTLKQATVKIQQYFRGFKAMQTETRARCAKLKSLYLIQAWCRALIARRNFAELMKPEVVEQRRIDKKRRGSATKIQATWRGYKARCAATKDLIAIRKRAAVVNRKAIPENTIRNRTSKNVSIIVNDRTTMLQMITSLEDLERNTRLCQVSCLSIARKLCNELYCIIASSSRSRCDMLACSGAAGILVNVAKYNKATEYSWRPMHLNDLMKAMLHYCDKENVLILKLFTLLWVFGHNDCYKAEILAIDNFEHHMRKMLMLCERQHKMVCKTYKGRNVSVFSYYVDLPLPTVKPDWGLDYDHAPHYFSNALHGIRSLCDLFNM